MSAGKFLAVERSEQIGLLAGHVRIAPAAAEELLAQQLTREQFRV